MSQTREEVAEGQMKVTRFREGWLLIEIGRGRYTKRFNLRDEEAAQLVDLLSQYLPSAD